MTLADAFSLITQAGSVGCLAIFGYLMMTDKLLTPGGLKRIEEGHEREKKQLREERDHARKESGEWKLMAMRGTELAQYLGAKATEPTSG
jgi:hypothetical protein